MRFTVLTPRLLRLEYSPDGRFIDQASQVFWFRQQPVPPFEVRREDGWLEIETTELLLRAQPELGDHPEALQITVKSSGETWRNGDKPAGNLKGTARTLDMALGPVPLEDGLLSRQGWTVVDDSRGLLFNEDGWLEARPGEPEDFDRYFFGYGLDYQACLQDFFQVAGPVPLIPRWALGNWWSRYWPYTQAELGRLMLDFKEHAVPLAVCIIDMDWHLTQTGNTSSGWTGYTWNRELFPNPAGFVRFLHGLKLRTALNLHPAEGIHPHEADYAAMAQAVGQDPGEEAPVVFEPLDPAFVQPYLEILHHPQEAMGIDFWWMDWQQGNPSRLPGLNLLWWINHLHFQDHGRDGKRRPFIFSRWGGLGNHRYPIGFSGDAFVRWEALAFQPYFTATAANVGYSWWSHDIGGHMMGIEDPELYLRWVQFGVFSPIMRLHSTNNPYHERRPWGYDAETERLASAALRLRHELIPYLYAMAWRNTTRGEALVRPLYHLAPGEEAAYACPDSYTFGSELIVTPFVEPAEADTRLSRQAAWLPPGDWYGFFDGAWYAGGTWHALYGTRAETPVFARAGAIVPLDTESDQNGADHPQAFSVQVFPGKDGAFTLYEDDGTSQDGLEGEDAQSGKSVRTALRLAWHGDSLEFTIDPAVGAAELVPEKRQFAFTFWALNAPDSVRAEIDGQPVEVQWTYDAARGQVQIDALALNPHAQLWLEIKAKVGLLQRAARLEARLRHML
ncbi:MAG: TIM-barrel domain-containing protein, partial [Anaerolineales bacterium]